MQGAKDAHDIQCTLERVVRGVGPCAEPSMGGEADQEVGDKLPECERQRIAMRDRAMSAHTAAERIKCARAA